MKLSLIAYITAISFQVSGALMLILYAISTKRKNVIRSFARSHMITRNGDTKELSYDHDAFVDNYRTAYFSKLSVCFIALGYLFGIFGDIGSSNRGYIALAIVVSTIFLILVSSVCVKWLLTKDSVQKRICNEELEAVGAEPDMESINSKVIKNTLVLGGTKALK